MGILDKHKVKYTANWNLSGLPFLTPSGALVDAVVAAVKSVQGIHAELSTAGGTSDGRFIAPTGAQVVELGPLNATIHKIDECVAAVVDEDPLEVRHVGNHRRQGRAGRGSIQELSHDHSDALVHLIGQGYRAKLGMKEAVSSREEQNHALLGSRCRCRGDLWDGRRRSS